MGKHTVLLMATLSGALALTGCGVDGHRPGDYTAPTLSPSATDSPWGYKPVDTSCTDWLQSMTAGQRATMTVELLDYLRTHAQLVPSPTQSAAVPTVDQAQVFEEALDAQCHKTDHPGSENLMLAGWMAYGDHVSELKP